MKLILHFGIHRTGSSSIQKTLVANRGALIEQGFLYPNISGKASHEIIPSLLLSKKILFHQWIDDIEQQTSNTTHSIILSSEDFCALKDYSFLQEIPDKYQTVVVIYLRRQDLWLESWYNQNVKWPWNSKFSGSSFDVFRKSIKDFYWIDYKRTLDRITKFLPREKLRINIFSEDGTQNSVDDFFNICGIESNDFKKLDKINKSLSSAKLDILRRINILGLKNEAKWKIVKVLGNMEIEEDNTGSTFFTPRQRQNVISRYSKSNEYVASSYFEREELFQDCASDKLKPTFVSDKQAYQKYIPQLLKKIAEG